MDYKKKMNQRSQIVANKRGLLAKAEAILAAEAAEKAAKEAKRARRHAVAHKLRRLVIGTTVGLILPHMATPLTQTQHLNQANLTAVQFPDHNRIDEAIKNFQQQLPPSVSEEERDMLAQLVYGEAGINAADGYEVIHTVQNRVKSPLFPNTVKEVITQKNQYAGYDAKNPVLPQIRKMVDIALMDWEDQHCEHYYFLTDQPGVSNKFEDGTGTNGRWQDKKTYEARGHYCETAQHQANAYRAMVKGSNEPGIYR